MTENWSVNAADAWYEGISARISSLVSFPARWPLAPECELLEFEVRQAYHGNKHNGYRILFCIVDSPQPTVRVMHVRHSARGPMKPYELGL